MQLFIGQRLTSSLPCCSGACFSLPFAIPRTPATFGFCASGIGGLSKDPLRFKPREKKNKSKVSLSGRVRRHCIALNQNLRRSCLKSKLAWRMISSLNQDGPAAPITKSVMRH